MGSGITHLSSNYKINQIKHLIIKKIKMPRIKKINVIKIWLCSGITIFHLGLSVNVVNAICCNCYVSSPENKTCIKGGVDACNKIPSLRESLRNMNCPDTVTDANCKSVSSGGVCTAGPIAAENYTGAESAGYSEPASVDLKLNVPIPGFTISSNLPRDIEGPEQFVMVDYLARYISSFYNFAVGISVIAAAVMLVYGGFLYIKESTISGVERGKKYIKDALIGLILILSSNLILNTLNPSTTELKALKIIAVPFLGIDESQSMLRAGDVEPTASVSSGSEGNKTELVKAIMKGAIAAGTDPCLMLANCNHETRLTATWNGNFGPRPLPKEKATAFGACGVTMRQVQNGTLLAKAIKAKYPDFPLLPKNQREKISKKDILTIGEWFLTNHEGDAYVASLMFQSFLVRAKNNELLAIAMFKGGDYTLIKWMQANNCTPTKKTVKDALSNPEAAIRVSCIPVSAALPNSGDPPQGCPEDKYECKDAKADQGSHLVGHCSDGRKCLASPPPRQSVEFILKSYKEMVEKYQCNTFK